MKKIRHFLTGLFFLFIGLSLNAQEYKILNKPEGLSGISQASGIDKPVSIKVIYDNYVKVEGLKEDWGYSILIEGLDKTILFDTGTRPEIFESNFSKMGLDAAKVDLLVLSHEHGDHTGGIPALLKMKRDIPVIIPFSFTDKFKKRMTESGLEPVLVKGPAMICQHIFTSGEFDYQIPEQALVLDTKQGLVVMTGCSHPGIVAMLEKIKADFNKNIYMVFGGFHLLQKTDKEMDSIISELKALGVVKCGATHCTGEKQIRMFKDSFGENYFELGAGNSFKIQ
jgi:7,8-dihydropterin-6-yl-methyl-4-(beta-D-ribofuranosyl)aminobenzene 5'-phosphate synthase